MRQGRRLTREGYHGFSSSEVVARLLPALPLSFHELSSPPPHLSDEETELFPLYLSIHSQKRVTNGPEGERADKALGCKLIKRREKPNSVPW